MIEQQATSVILSNKWFHLKLSTAEQTTRLVESLALAPQGDGCYAAPLAITPWTGFAGVTSHTREFFLTTEMPQSPSVEILEDTPDVSSICFGPLTVASWNIHWTLTLQGNALRWEVMVHVGRKTLPDDEINLLAFDLLPDDEFQAAHFDTGYIFPPKQWFAIDKPEVTYRGNDERGGVLDRRPRFKFSGDGHDTLHLDLKSGARLSLTSRGNNIFRIVPSVVFKPEPPRDPNRLQPAEFEFKSFERIAVGTTRWKDAGDVPAHSRFYCDVTLQAGSAHPVETMSLSTADASIAERTKAYHRTHAHGSIAHRWGYAGGWHNTGRPNAHSVSFEYYMHGKAHFFSMHPASEQIMANAIDSVLERETHPDGLIWQHGFGGRGAFYENNASMLIFLADYVRRTGDFSKLHAGCRWADYILDNCAEQPFLYLSPNSTGLPGFDRGAYICNWWDVVACGGYDAFINVLTYPGLRDLSLMLAAVGQSEAATRYGAAAEKLRTSFNELFWNESAGRYICWVDTEGAQHDYFFTGVNLIAAWEGIADKQQRQRILNGINQQLDRIGYRGFSLPGNLISIPPEHYNAGDWWMEEFGYPHFYDPFGVYENGGIWVWVSAYYIAALAEFDPDAACQHYRAILDQYDRDNLQGAGNGYFWNPQTGEITEGSKLEPYLANTSMTIWGFMTLFGVQFDFTGGLRLEPRMPAEISPAQFEFRYHGKRLQFKYQGSGQRISKLLVDDREFSSDATIPAAELRDGSVIDVTLAEAHRE